MSKIPFVCVLHLSACDQCPSVKDAASVLWLYICSWRYGRGRMGAGRLKPSTQEAVLGCAGLCWALLGCASTLLQESLFGIWQSFMVSAWLSDCTLGSSLQCHNSASITVNQTSFSSAYFVISSLTRMMIKNRDDADLP